MNLALTRPHAEDTFNEFEGAITPWRRPTGNYACLWRAASLSSPPLEGGLESEAAESIASVNPP